MCAVKKKWYGIWLKNEDKTIVTDSWDECKRLSDGVPGAQRKSFELESEARNFKGNFQNKGPAVLTKAPPQMSISFLADKPAITLEERSPVPIKLPRVLPTEVTIYTDGSCFNLEPGEQSQVSGKLYPGGYAAVFLDMQGNELMRINGGEQATTNNRMELTAVKEALQCLDDGTKHKVHIFSDSQYVVNSYTKGWISSWKRAGTKIGDEIIWRKAGTLEEVKNQDLMKSIDILRQKHDVEFTYTRAHVGTKNNEICDKLAKSMSRKMNQLKNTVSKREDKGQPCIPNTRSSASLMR